MGDVVDDGGWPRPRVQGWAGGRTGADDHRRRRAALRPRVREHGGPRGTGIRIVPTSPVSIGTGERLVVAAQPW